MKLKALSKKLRNFHFQLIKVTATNKEFLDFTKQNGFSSLANINSKTILVLNNELHLKNIDSYITSDIAAFLRYNYFKLVNRFRLKPL